MYLKEDSGDNGTYCNETYSLAQKNTFSIVLESIGFVSFSSCVIAVSLVFCLRLHKLFIYRHGHVSSAVCYDVQCYMYSLVCFDTLQC